MYGCMDGCMDVCKDVFVRMKSDRQTKVARRREGIIHAVVSAKWGEWGGSGGNDHL